MQTDLIQPDGSVRCIYDEAIDLAAMGSSRSPGPATSSRTTRGMARGSGAGRRTDAWAIRPP